MMGICPDFLIFVGGQPNQYGPWARLWGSVVPAEIREPTSGGALRLSPQGLGELVRMDTLHLESKIPRPIPNQLWRHVGYSTWSSSTTKKS